MRRFGFYAVLTLLTLVALAMVAVNYVSNNFKIATTHRGSGDDVSIDSPLGHIKVRSHQNIDPAALGMPVYPGAKLTKDKVGASFEWTSADGTKDRAFAVAGGEYVTTDSVDTVRAWYQENYPNWVVVTDHDHNNARFELNGSGKRLISLRPEGDGTHIGVATVGEPASN